MFKCYIALPAERYTATKEKLYLSDGKMRSVFYLNNCYNSLIFPQMLIFNPLSAEEERLEKMQEFMNRLKLKDIKSLMELNGYERDEIIERDEITEDYGTFV